MATDRLSNKAADRLKAKRTSGGDKRDAKWLFLKDKFDIGVEAKRPFEKTWILTLAFLAGNQWTQFNSAAHILDPIKKPQNKMRCTDNLLLPKWRRQIADLIKTDPTMSVVPQTDDEDDIEAAKTGDKVIKSFWQTNQLRMKIRQMGGWMYGTGNGFIDDRWNPKLGPVEKQKNPKTGETELVYLGDADCGVWSPFEIFVPFIAMGETDLHSFPWLIKAKRRSLDWGANNYDRGGEVKEESFSGSAMSTASLMGTSQESLSAKVPSATFMDFYLQPNKEYPKGLFLTGANGIILAQKDYPINYYHLEHFKDIDVPGVFWGQATASNALGLQFTWNTALTSAVEFNRIAKAKMLVPRQAKMEIDPDDQHGQIIRYNPVYGLKPEYLTLKGLPPTLDQVMALTKTSLMDLFNQHEVSQGTNKSDIRSGEMVSLLREQDAHGNIPSHAIVEESLGRLIKRVLERIRKEYTTDRMLKVMGDEGEFQVFKFKGADLRNNTDIIVRKESTLPDSRVDREARILKKYELGLYGPIDDPKIRRSVMRMIEDVAANSLYEPDRLDERIAERENHILMQAEGMDKNAAIALVNQYDNHVIHEEIMTRFRKSTDYQKLKYSDSEEDSMKFRDMESRFDAHNDVHKEFIAEQQEALLQQQLILQGGGSKNAGSK